MKTTLIIILILIVGLSGCNNTPNTTKIMTTDDGHFDSIVSDSIKSDVCAPISIEVDTIR